MRLNEKEAFTHLQACFIYACFTYAFIATSLLIMFECPPPPIYGSGFCFWIMRWKINKGNEIFQFNMKGRNNMALIPCSCRFFFFFANQQISVNLRLRLGSQHIISFWDPLNHAAHTLVTRSTVLVCHQYRSEYEHTREVFSAQLCVPP